jgi:hypothetical protein
LTVESTGQLLAVNATPAGTGVSAVVILSGIAGCQHGDTFRKTNA